MLLNRRAPYGTGYAQEALEVALAGAAFEQRVCLVFMDDGVFALKRGQEASAIGMKNFWRAYRALSDMGLERLVVERASLGVRGLDAGELLLPVEVMSSEDLGRLVEEQDVVLSF